MLRFALASTLLILLLTAFPGSAAEITREYDVVVYGGTAGGAIAAVAAAQEGQRVALLEPRRHIGGMVSGGLGATDFGNKAVIGGMSLEFFKRLGKHYGEEISWYFEPHMAEKIFRDWLDEAKVAVFFEHRVDTVNKEGARLVSITLENSAVFAAKVFIDASYEGDLLPRAGIRYTWGREGQEAYGESLAGRIEYSPKHQFLVQVDPYDAAGSFSPLVYTGNPGKPGQGDRKVQAYNFRLCLSNRKENQAPYPKPEGYDPARYDLLKRYLAAAPGLKLDKLLNVKMMPNGKTDMNNNGPISTDYIGGSWEYPEADYARREKIWKEHEKYVQGFLYFMANDPGVPKKLQEEFNRWGLAKDEFLDTNHWPNQLYIREARRMMGEYVMHQADLQTDRSKPDSIGMGSYNSDSHHVQRIAVTGSAEWPGVGPGVLNEGDMQVPVRPYEIAYRALLPKRGECKNLFVTGCVSASHVTYSSIRMEPQYMIMGHAAGIAANLAIRANQPIQDIDVAALQARLREQQQILSMEDADGAYINPKKLPGVVVDNADAATTGTWERSTSVTPFIGLDYAHHQNEGQGVSTIRFIPELPAPGKYEVRFGYTANPNRATNATVTIQTADGPKTVAVNERKEPGKTAPFISLGVFDFPAGNAGAVEVSTAGADGYVVADAVQWLAVQ